jgi:hypothetical protein
MPNIEIHGKGIVEARQVRRLIRTALSETPYNKKVVTTLYRTNTTDYRSESVPFLRVYTDADCPFLDSLLNELSALLGWDIEVLTLIKFVPATSRRL